ncbi:hypothetical protein EON81_28620, partial [bacterium]
MKLFCLTLGLAVLSASILSGCGGDGNDNDRRDTSVPAVEDVVPTISTQPSDVSTTIGASATFRVAANGGSLSYQWYGGTNGRYAAIPNARAATYSTDALRTSENGSLFYVVVINPKGAARSGFAKLTVATDILMPKITSEPADVSVKAGENVSLSVVGSGGGLAY